MMPCNLSQLFATLALCICLILSNITLHPDLAQAAGNKDFGSLGDLVGTWRGEGFNLIELPTNDSDTIFRVDAQPYEETLTFTPVGDPVANRGNNQPDQFIEALKYEQIIANANTHDPLHDENGMFLVMDSATQGYPVARLGTIPHGDSVLALGPAAQHSKTGPTIIPVDSTPVFSNGTFANRPPYMEPFADEAQKSGYSPDVLKDPTLILKAYLQKQENAGRTITETMTLRLSTRNRSGGIVNIPFLADADNNLEATDLDLTLWLEKGVDQNTGREFQQLQYAQVIDLDYTEGIIWPHIAVSTLTKQ